MDIVNYLNYTIESLNNNKYFIGVMMVLLNVGSRYIFLELGKIHDDFFNQKIVRRILIFTVFFVATRDIIASVILSAFFILFFLELTHENSKLCIVPKKYIKMNVTEDGKVAVDEIKKAYLTLKNAGEIENFRNKKTQ